MNLAQAARLLAPGYEPTPQAWRALRLLAAYRVFLASAGLLGYLSNAPPELLGSSNPQLYLLTVCVYLAAAGFYYYASLRQRIGLDLQAYSQAYLDILAIALLMHASGGIGSGLGMLLIVHITAIGTLVPGRHALLFAAMASLAILAEQLYAQSLGAGAYVNYSQAGILGATLFATALLAITLTQRSRESAALAKQREIDLENLAALNEHIIQRMDSGILVIDNQGRLRLANEYARFALQLPVIESPPALAEVAPRLAYALNLWRERPEAELASFSEPGSRTEWRPQFMPLGGSGVLVFLEDATFINQQLQQLKLASLGRLTASIAHEIRNPLGAISHAAQLLAESPQLERGDQRLTHIVLDHCRRMNRLIEDVLQLSRGGNANPVPVALDKFLPRFAEEFQLSEQLPPGVLAVQAGHQPLDVWVDQGHLQQVLWNLCKNSLLHGRPPARGLRIDLVGGLQGDSGYPYLEVRDNGGGIDEDRANEIFEPFYTSSRSGTGLGLFLARELCEFNGAALSYQRLDSGSCFRIVFKRAVQQDRAANE